MLTVHADAHALMRNVHKPDDEKRMVVVLPESQYDAWLDAPVEASMRYMQQFAADGLATETPVS
jgi:putative SOS response-associated peptidase YedK